MRLAPFAPQQDLQPVPFPLQPVEQHMLYIFVTRHTHAGALKNAWVHLSPDHPEHGGMHTPCIAHHVDPFPGDAIDERDVSDAVNAVCRTLEVAGVEYTKFNC